MTNNNTHTVPATLVGFVVGAAAAGFYGAMLGSALGYCMDRGEMLA